MTTPRYQAIENSQMGRHAIPGGGEIEVIAGSYNGTSGPATTFSPVHLYNVKPKKGASVELSFPAEYSTAILAVEGRGLINGSETLPTDNLAVLGNDGELFTIKALEDSTFLVMSGEPLNEPIASYGPFLMNTQAEIAQAIDDYQRGKFGYLAD